MRKRSAAALGLGLALVAGGVLAQGAGPVPVEQDLRRLDRLERRIEAGQETPGPVLPRDMTPANPGGVPGFSGGPGTVGDSVLSHSPLPPGAPGNEIR